ncbi:F0F1 ATP synthase subunit A [Candidatus Gracilibacteria bacterium]|nr:F0F1 ATP synthase subunit A [Candidatus Gracilibacteria bacterium]
MSATGPHIPQLQGERIESFGNIISNTNFSTIIFFFIILAIAIMANRALKSKKKSKLRTFFLSFIKLADEQIRSAFSNDKTFSRKYFPLIVGLFLIVFLGNLWGLVIDWAGSSISGDLFYYLRPIHSDLNTTVALALLVTVVFLGVGVKTHGGWSYAKSFLFNFTGDGIIQKCINVFVGWLHFIGIGSTVASLSLRLFGNIFAGIVLIGVISYLGVLITANQFEFGRFLSIPFWFFELFVSIVQALVFTLLTLSYIGQAREEH